MSEDDNFHFVNNLRGQLGNLHKLTRYVVDDGAHLAKGEAYAEVEVMKMLFLLNVSEAGTISLSKDQFALDVPYSVKGGVDTSGATLKMKWSTTIDI